MDIVATTIQQQLEILSSRNITLSPDSEEILLQYGYYNLINGYKDAFIDHKASKEKGVDYYKDGTTLDQIVVLYKFDSGLRRNLLDYITVIETQVKSLISLHFSLLYGTNHSSYLSSNSFTANPWKKRHVTNLIRTLTNNISKFSSRNPHPAICHFLEKHDQIPLWGLNTIMSFGTMANFYDLLQDHVKKQIAQSISPRIKPRVLSSILYYLTGIRNKCAHNNRLYTHKIDQKATRTSTIPQLKLHKRIGLTPSNTHSLYVHGQDDILAALLCIAILLEKNPYYKINYTVIDDSLKRLSKTITPDVETYVRNVTGLLPSYLNALENDGKQTNKKSTT